MVAVVILLCIFGGGAGGIVNSIFCHQVMQKQQFSNTGSGGGGHGRQANGTQGGSGIVVVRYQIGQLSSPQKQLVVQHQFL